MKSITNQIDVSTSYRVNHHSKIFEPAFALDVVLSNKDCCYHDAIWSEDYTVTLKSTDVICPYCGIVHSLKRHMQFTQWQINTMKEWTNPQLTLFPREEIKTELAFFSANLSLFTCPHCGNQSDNKNNHSTIWITQSKNKITVRCEVKDLVAILNLPYFPRKWFSIEFPFYEQIEFNFRNGHTCIRAMTDNNRILHTVDITNTPAILADCELAKWFPLFDTVKQSMVDGFQTATNTPVPIDFNDIVLEDFVFFTRFVGYNKTFYASIPYDKETLVIDRSFRGLERLHSQTTAVDYLSSFSFTRYKSTRKQVCEQMGLLFYLPECEALYQAIGDVNVFRNILDCKYVFGILITLHEHPISLDFIADYCKVKGASGLFKKINSPKSTWLDFRCYMLNYCSLSPYSKSLEQKKWKDKSGSNYMNRSMPTNYSLPMTQSTPSNAKCVIDGFHFKPLRNTSECFKVGKKLSNCLRQWDSYDSVVVSVILGNEVVAAFEVWDKAIAQAHTYKNGCIDEIKGLPEAIEKWASRNMISCSTKDLIEKW